MVTNPSEDEISQVTLTERELPTNTKTMDVCISDDNDPGFCDQVIPSGTHCFMCLHHNLFKVVLKII